MTDDEIRAKLAKVHELLLECVERLGELEDQIGPGRPDAEDGSRNGAPDAC